MSEFYDGEISRLHEMLRELYVRTPGDTIRINGLWARIERLQAQAARLTVKESQNG